VQRIWANAQRNWPNARAFGQLRERLAKRARIWPNARAIYQTLRIWSNSARLTNWSNALRIWPNAQIDQMRLTLPVVKLEVLRLLLQQLIMANARDSLSVCL